MNPETIKRKRRKLIVLLTALGFGIAAIIWGYSEWIDSLHPRSFSFALSGAFMILCPPSLLSVPLIDIEPGSGSFALMWLVIGPLKLRALRNNRCAR